MRHLSDDIVLSVKDAVRNLRYALRSEAGYRFLPAVGSVAHHSRRAIEVSRRQRIAGLVDRVFTDVESGALALISTNRGGSRIVFPRPVWAYFGDAGSRSEEAAERLFVRAHYQVAKDLLHKFGARNILIFEHVMSRARDAVLARHGDLVRSVRASAAMFFDEESSLDRTRLCAAITCCLVKARPIKEAELNDTASGLPQGLVASTNAFCFLVTGLATAVVSREEGPEPLDLAEILASAVSVVDVRFGRFLAAVQAPDAVEALTSEFAKIAPFLP